MSGGYLREQRFSHYGHIQPAIASAMKSLSATAAASGDHAVSPENRLIEIQSTVVFDDILHFSMLPNGETDEDWGIDGIERILDVHVDADLDIAKGFFRKMDRIMQGNDQIVVAITDDGDVVDIRIKRTGRETFHYHNRFIFFESVGWWHSTDLQVQLNSSR
ncbi:hypothetical protein EN933_29590 [Mesorhizobium sp. M7A.F.Ca.US.001.01.1.1]|nr:hypothetical protein EN933_29590 [Mesorhizobium sp. M7A.F.Ca.US.001.01.1.1]